MNTIRNFARLAALGTVVAAAAAATATAADRRLIIVSEGVSRDWQRATGTVATVPGYPPVVADRSADVCVGIGYLIGKDGLPSEFTVLKTWSSAQPDAKKTLGLDPFTQSAVGTVQGWRFEPVAGKRSPKPNYTAATFAFSSKPATDKGELIGRCKVSDLPSFIAEAQAEAFKRGNINKGLIDRSQSLIETPNKK